MSDGLKTSIHQIKLEENSLHEPRDIKIASDLYERYHLQSVLETVSDFVKDGILQKGCEHYLMVARALIENAPQEWINVFVKGFEDHLTHSLCVGCLRSLSRIAEASTFSQREYYVYDKEDFTGLSHKGFLVLSLLQTLFKRCCSLSNIDKAFSMKCLVQICIISYCLISRHMEENFWTNSETKMLAESFMDCLKAEFGCSSVSELLAIDVKTANDSSSLDNPSVKTSVFGVILQQWNPLLQRSCWQQNPVVAACFSWSLSQLRFPHASAFIELLIPPALLFIDDTLLENKVMGVKCLVCIIQNVSAEELRWYGRADVIFEALKLQMYRTEEVLLRYVHKALLLILPVIVKRNENIAVTTKYDEIFLLILQSATHENKLALRRVHTENIHCFIECLGICVVKYISQLLELTEEYIEISDPPLEEARINVLKALLTLLKVAWPRIPAHSNKIIKILVKALHQVTSNDLLVSESTKMEMISFIVNCLTLLKDIDTSVIQKLRSLPYTNACASIIYSLL